MTQNLNVSRGISLKCQWNTFSQWRRREVRGHMTSSLTSENSALELDGGGDGIYIFFYKSSKRKIEQPFCAANMKMQIHGKMFCSFTLLKGASHDLTRFTAYACHSIYIQTSQNFSNHFYLVKTVMETQWLPQRRWRLCRAAWVGRYRCRTTAPTPVTVRPSAATLDTFEFSSAPSHICFAILNSPRTALWPPCCQLWGSGHRGFVFCCLHSLPASNCSKFGRCTCLFIVSSEPPVNTRGSRQTCECFLHTSEAYQGEKVQPPDWFRAALLFSSFLTSVFTNVTRRTIRIVRLAFAICCFSFLHHKSLCQAGDKKPLLAISR